MCLAQGPQRSDAGEAQTRGLSVSSQALYHRATALLMNWCDPLYLKKKCFSYVPCPLILSLLPCSPKFLDFGPLFPENKYPFLCSPKTPRRALEYGFLIFAPLLTFISHP